MENSRIVIFEKYYVFLIFLILLDSIFGDTAVQRIYGELNGNITLRPGVTGTIKEILWKHNGDKAAEFTRPDPVQSYRDFQHRVILNITTGHLTITKLNYKDNGQYMAESQLDEKQQLQYYTVNLTVIEPITLPIVQCTKNETAAKLLCSAKGPNLQYSWKGGSISTPTWSPEPTELVIIKEDDPDSIYTCLVKSEASNRSSEAYKVAECTVGSSLIYSIMTVVIILVAVVVIAGGFLLYRLRRQGTNYQKVQQNPDIESNRNKNDQDPSSSGNYPPNTGRETEERTNAGTGARKALPGSKMNEMVLTDREKQMHESERAANQEGKGNVKYESPSEVKDDKKPNQTDEEKEDLLQKGTTEGDVKQEGKKMDAIVVNKDKNGVKKTDSQEEDEDQREEENIEPQDEDEAQKVEEKKTDPQKENKDRKEEKPDPQKENKDRKEKTDLQKENKDRKEEKTDPQKENKDRKEEKTDPEKENKDRKEEKTDPQKENKDCKEEKTDPQKEDKDENKEENIEPQDEDEAQKVEEKKTDPQKENKDRKEEKTDSQAKEDQKEEEKKNDPQEEDKDQKEEEKQGEENRNS